MKQIRRLTALLLAVMLLSTMFGAAALAAKKTKYVSKANRTVLPIALGADIAMQNYWRSGDPIYELTLAQDSLVTVSWSGNSGNSAYNNAYADATASKPISRLYFDLRGESGTLRCVVPVGVYYFELIDGNQTTHITFTAAPLTEFKNYTASRAKSLKANVPTTVAMTRMEMHPVWYKIKLTKKQRITVTSDNDEYSIILYDSRGRRIHDVAGFTKSVATSKKVAKGTYYIRVDPQHTYYSKYPKPFTFSWR